MTKPSVLVLLATHNGERYIREQLGSLAQQTGVTVTVIASDDGSVDSTVDVATIAAQSYGLDFAFLGGNGKFGGAAKNFYHLIAEADFSTVAFVALCDQDDVWLPNKLARAAQVLCEKRAEIYSCNSIAFWPDCRETAIKKDFPFKRWDYLFESASHGCTYVLSSRAARGLQEFVRERRIDLECVEFHDWLIYAWARHYGKAWVCDSEHLIRYRQTYRNAIGANVGWRAALRRMQQMRKGWYRCQSLQIARAIGASGMPIVRRLTRFAWYDRIHLAFRATQCRRSRRDQAAFAVALLFLGM